MKLKKLFKILFVFTVLAALFKLQYNLNLRFSVFQKEFSISSTYPFSPSQSDDNSNAEQPHSSKDLIRLEIFLLFLFLLTYFAFSFNIFQYPSFRIWLPDKIIPQLYRFHKFNNRAPPFEL